MHIFTSKYKHMQRQEQKTRKNKTRKAKKRKEKKKERDSAEERRSREATGAIGAENAHEGTLPRGGSTNGVASPSRYQKASRPSPSERVVAASRKMALASADSHAW